MRVISLPYRCYGDEPSFWGDFVNSTGSLFHSAEWSGVLNKAFSAHELYFYDDTTMRGFVLHVFSQWPFRVGYAGFPSGTSIAGAHIHVDELNALFACCSTYPHVIRIQQSAFVDCVPVMSLREQMRNDKWLPETRILDLPGSDHREIKKIRRDIVRAQQQGICIRGECNDDDVAHIYRLYVSAMSRHGAATKYNEAYFRGVVGLAKQKMIHIFLAELQRRVVGFVILAVDQACAYYLHGAIDFAHKACGISDVLLDAAITRAKEIGAVQFNFMPSPPRQTTLVKYKEKWGGETRMQHNYELAFNPLMASAMDAAIKLRSFLSGGK